MALCPVLRLDGAAIQIHDLLFVFACYDTIEVHAMVVSDFIKGAVFMDTQIWYAIFSTIVGGIYGEFRRLREIVNGPEVLSKFVGDTEKNVRDLFADAEQDQRTRGDESDLHVIIFDEIDAICKSRGSTRDGTGVHDSIVNQLLSKTREIGSPG